MKLLTKTNRYYLLSSCLVFLVGGLIFYEITQAIIKDEISEVLDFELEKKIEKISQQQGFPKEVEEIEFEVERANKMLDLKVYKDTVFYDELGKELIPYRQLTLYRNIKGQPYRLTFRESLIESDGIFFAVSVSLAVLLGLMVIALWFVNYFQARRLWAGFYENIHHLRYYDVAMLGQVPKIDSDIDEFREMNTAIIKMTDKIRNDYLLLKEFTENASHEMQTPLAIIRSNLDLLMQSELQENQHTLISRISQATQRMTSTHRALLLLSKIENKQFKESTTVDLRTVITSQLEELSEFISAKRLRVNLTNKSEKGLLTMNPKLADILVNNLLTNAIKHNIQDGNIDIHLTTKMLKISNSGPVLRADPQKLFQRFVKDNPSGDSTGLGMAIIKVICDVNQIGTTYEYDQEKHMLTLQFPNAPKKNQNP